MEKAMSEQMNGGAAVIDWSPAVMLERLGGDDELARQLVELFIAECPLMMAVVRDSVASGDPDQVRRGAHAFKGSVGNFTDDAPMTTAAELEHLGREGQIDRARVLLARLEVEVEAFLDALHRFEQGTS
jgi:HPt (histidine-containing phosphotransfer) domain-containing protein